MKYFKRIIYNTKISTLCSCFIYWLIFIVLLMLAGFVSKIMLSAKWERLTYGVFGTIAAITATWLLLKFEKSSFADYGLIWQKQTITNFVKGIVIGTGIFILIIALLLIFSNIKFTSNSESLTFAGLLWYLTIIPLALMEEIAFRSYGFIKLNKAFGLRYTQLIVAIAFALYHFVQGWPWHVSLLGPGIWAFVFGLGAYYGKGIAMPTGIHTALNIIQPLIGMKSGNYQSLWLMQTNDKTTAFVSSNTIGLLVQILILITAIIITEVLMLKKGRAFQ